MEKTLKNLSALDQLPERTIELAHKSVQGAIPSFWPTYRAGITIEHTPEHSKLSLDGGKIEGAVNQHIIDWAQKVFPLAGLESPSSSADYVNAGGGAYPLRIEQSGSPSYPGNRAIGAGQGVWLIAGQIAREEIMRYIKELAA
jgi:hypothetical protein